MGLFDGIFGGALGAAGSIFNGIMGYKGQQEANKTNLQIARETNQANRENQEYQNEWNLNMWNAQNEYNTPAAQRQRLEQAGLNPIFYGLDGNGNAGALTSADYTAVPGAPMDNAGQFLGAGIGNAAREMAEINLLKSQAKKVESETDQTELLNSITRATKDDVISGAHYSMLVTKGTVDVTENTAELINKQCDEIGQRIDLMTQQISQIQQSMKLDQFRTMLDATCQMLHLQNEQAKIFNDFFIDLYNCNLSEKRLALDTRVGNAQIQLLGSQSKVAEETARGLGFVNDVNEARAKNGIISGQLTKEKRQLIWDLEFLDDKNINALQTMDKTFDILSSEAHIKFTESEWAEFNSLMNSYSSILGSLPGLGKK